MTSCSNPNAESHALMTRRPRHDRSKACVKCKLKTGNIVIRYAVYCKECFFPLISSRFRRALEPHVNPTPQLHRRKGLKASGNLLIGFSGGLGSSVLLDLVHKTYLTLRERQEGDQNPNGGCPWPEIFVATVDISRALNLAPSGDSNFQRLIESYSSQFKCISLNLEDAFDRQWWKEAGGSESYQSRSLNIINKEILLKELSGDSSPTESLRTYISSLPTPTAVANAIQVLVRMLLLYTAASRRCSHLLLGTSLASLSISLISSISQGGGYSVREETHEEWSCRRDTEASDQTVRVIRPLRDIGSKECAFWAWWNRLKIAKKYRYSGGRQDIAALTRDFILGLEKDYPSTVSTIVKTCNKLTTKEDSDLRCLMCDRLVQAGIQDWKNKISIRSYLDTKAENVPPSHVRRPPEIPKIQNLKISDTMTSRLCYACHTTWTSKSIRGGIIRGTNIPAPIWTSVHSMDGDVWARKKVDVQDMQAIIGDSLLDSA